MSLSAFFRWLAGLFGGQSRSNSNPDSNYNPNTNSNPDSNYNPDSNSTPDSNYNPDSNSSPDPDYNSSPNSGNNNSNNNTNENREEGTAENPILIDFTTDSDKVTLYDDIEFKVETSPRGYYENIEISLEGTQNIKIIQPFDRITGTIIIRFNKRSRHRDEVQTVIAMDGNTILKHPITVSLMQLLWKHHAGRANVCDGERFRNQCAIRMGEALELSDIRLSSRRTVLRRCSSEFNGYSDHKHGKVKGHVLAAQELANWIKTQTGIFGKRHILYSKEDVLGRSGILFIRDGWDTTDHIDVWNGKSLVGGFDSYFESDYKELWFWDVY